MKISLVMYYSIIILLLFLLLITLAWDNIIKVEINYRLKKGYKCYYGLGKLLSSKAV